MAVIERILVSLRDPVLREALTEAIHAETDLWAVACPPDGECPEDFRPNLILIDSESGSDGVTAGLRDTDRPPAIIVGAAPRPPGIDPERFVATPVHVTDLLSQIRAVLRAERAKTRGYRIGSARFVLGPASLTGIEGEGKRLTEKERDTLAYLCAAGERPVSRRELLASIWGYGENIETQTAENHISRLRGLLREIGANATLEIKSGQYRLLPPAIPVEKGG